MKAGTLFPTEPRGARCASATRSSSERLRRLDVHGDLRKTLAPHCRLKYGEIWQDQIAGHKVGVLDATKADDVRSLFGVERARLVVNDPPYNLVVGSMNTSRLPKVDLNDYLSFSESWVRNACAIMSGDSHLYVWMGTDYRDGFQPLPDFMLLMRRFAALKPRNIITLRNQRGYGTQRNWMWVRQELLYYTLGDPGFYVEAEYTDIPRILHGYYKTVNGRVTENGERCRSQFIRAGNVWVDIQQVFYRLEENVPGCYAQKPLKATERIVLASTAPGDTVADFFAHSGTTLIAGERQGRRVYTMDIDPVFAEITIRRLEHYRATGKTGWQWRSPFPEIETQGVAVRWT